MAGRSGSLIKQVEHGQVRPSLATIGALARALDCDVTDLFTGTGPIGPGTGTELGDDTDAWVQAMLAAAPQRMTEDAARLASAALFRRAEPPTLGGAA